MRSANAVEEVAIVGDRHDRYRLWLGNAWLIVLGAAESVSA
jgi:hypothetical protein